MLNQLSEIAPAGALVAATVWGGLSYFVTGPEIASRIAHVEHVTTCERTLAATISSSFDDQIARAARPSQIEQQGSMASAYMGGMAGQYPEHMQFLDIISGGGFSQSMQAMNGAAAQARAARKRAEDALERQRTAAIETAPDQCSCQVAAAISENRNDWALFAGTFGLIEQDGVKELASHMRANGRMCSDRVQL